ncbi:MAG TPA: heme-binding protein [Legionella sp.]|nr:heme-binding protein [Legionella sp.]
MNRLTLEKANAIIEAGFIESKKLSLQPMSIVILDPGGHLIAFQRQDKAGILRFDIAFAKAYGALGMGINSRDLALKANEIPDLIQGAIAASKGRLIPAPGGMLILNNDNVIIGAAGASGDTSDNDEHVVISGILSVGLILKPS